VRSGRVADELTSPGSRVWRLAGASQTFGVWPSGFSQLLPLWQKPQFSLVAKRQNAHLVPGYDEAIEGDITRLAVGNNKLAQFALDAPANKRVRRQIIDGRLNRGYGL